MLGPNIRRLTPELLKKNPYHNTQIVDPQEQSSLIITEENSNDKSEYVEPLSLQVTVTFLFALPIASVAWVIYVAQGSSEFESWSKVKVCFTLWTVCEATFLAWFLLRLFLWQKPSRPPPLKTSAERLMLWGRMLNAMPDGPKQWFSSWFSGEPFENLAQGDIELFLSSVFFSKSPSKLSMEETQDLRQMVQMLLEADSTVDFSHGNKTPAKPEKMFLYMSDSLFCWPSSILVYAIVASLHIGTSIRYMRHGYRRRSAGAFMYWYRSGTEPSERTSDAPRPLVFIPGVGAGGFMYHGCIKLVEEDKSRPIFIVEIPQVGMYASNWLPWQAEGPSSPDNVAISIEFMLNKHGHSDGAVFAAHSYGSTYISYTIKRKPNLVLGNVWVEPCTFLCHLNKMTKNYLYSLGVHVSAVGTLFHMEPHIKYTLMRRFVWYEGCFFADQFNTPTVILVSLGDTIMPSPEIINHVKKVGNPMVQVVTFPPGESGTWQDHGCFATDARMNNQICDAIIQVCEKSRSTVETTRNNSRAGASAKFLTSDIELTSQSGKLVDRTAVPEGHLKAA